MFSVSNEFYKTAIVTIDDSPFKIDKLTEGSKFNFVTDTVFLMNLVRGDKSLHYLMDANGKEHFFIRNGSIFILLSCKRYLKRDETGGLVLIEDKRYIGQLMNYLQDCKFIQGKLTNVKYERKYLVKLFQAYYTCTGGKIDFQDKAYSKPFEIGAFAGVSMTKLKFSDAPAYLQDADYPTSYNISLGVFYNWIFPRHFGRISISNELHYISYKTEASYNSSERNVQTKLGLHYLQMNNMFRYKYPVKNATCFINAGISTGYGFSETNYKYEKSSFHGDSSGPIMWRGLTRLSLGVPIGIGIKYRKYSVEARYHYGLRKLESINGANNPGSQLTSLFLLLGYQF